MSGFDWNDKDQGDFRDIPMETSEEFHKNPTAFQSQMAQPTFAAQRPNQRPGIQEAYAQITEPVSVNDFDPNDIDLIDEDDDYTAILNNANLRLEQGKVWQQLINHDLFAETDYDPQAIQIVQRAIKRFAREQMEIMLGMRNPSSKDTAAIIIPFNDLEVTVLKMIASKATGGASQTPEANETAQKVATATPAPKREGFTPIGKKPAPAPRSQPQKPFQKAPQAPVVRAKAETSLPPSVFEPDYKPLNKSIHEMSQAEIEQRNKDASARQANRKAAIPSERAPMPSADQMARVYEMQIGSSDPTGTVNAILHLMNRQKGQ